MTTGAQHGEQKKSARPQNAHSVHSPPQRTAVHATIANAIVEAKSAVLASSKKSRMAASFVHAAA
jgi:hypothetical protein